MDKPMPKLAFAIMTLIFKIRDFIRPPKDKLKDIGIKPGDHVLDYACGPGSFSIEAARLVGKTGKVVSIDIHESAIASVKNRASAEGLGNIVPIQADSPAGLETESFDVVIMFDVFHDLSKPEAMLRELHRVMKPDAVFSFDDHHMKDDAVLSALTKDGFFELSKRADRCFLFHKAAQQA